MPSRKTQALSQRLLVEGKEDRHVIWNLCNLYKVPEVFEICIPVDTTIHDRQHDSEEGINALLDSLYDQVNSPNLKTLGLVVDADQALSSRWHSLFTRLSDIGYQNLPESLPDDGLVHESHDPYIPRLGVWIMPDNQLPGILEDFAVQLIAAEDPLLAKVDQTLTDLENTHLNQYSPAKRPKARIYTWLAWQKRPGMPMGQAITAKVLNGDSAVSRRFLDWLRRLFIMT